MKNKIIIVFGITFLLSLIAAIATPSIIESLIARSDNNVVTIEWKSLDESNVISYEIERGTSDNDLNRIASIDPRGSNSIYKYVDEDAFAQKKTKQPSPIKANNIFSYRLKMIHPGNSYSYSRVIYVTHNISSIRRTWGMIKEMFR